MIFSIYWDLSPDGQEIALATRTGLRIISLADRTTRSLPVPGYTSFQQIAWSADGSGVFATPVDTADYVLLFVTRQGEPTVVWRNPSRWISRLRPSFDGHHLAFAAMTYESNVWLLENFLPPHSD